MQLEIIGQVHGETGYSIHTRSLALALNEVADVRIQTGLFQDWEKVTPSKIAEMIRKPERNCTKIMISSPTSLKFLSDGRTDVIPFVVWEGDRLHTSWVDSLNMPFVKRIFVPSEHSKQAVINSGIEKKIDIIPHGVDSSTFNTEIEPWKNPVQDGRFTFMFCKGWSQGVRDRSGFDIFLKAFCEEFKPTEAVCASAKINSSYANQFWNLADEINKLDLPMPHERPPILINTQMLQHDKVASMMRGADCFVSPSKAEGFNMPCLEAMACGVPVIATNYGGHTDFVNKDNGWLIDVEKMVKATDSNYMYEETKWAIPSIKNLRKLMRYAFEHQDEAKAKGIAAEMLASSCYKWSDSAKKVMEALDA